MIKVCQRFTAG